MIYIVLFSALFMFFFDRKFYTGIVYIVDEREREREKEREIIDILLSPYNRYLTVTMSTYQISNYQISISVISVISRNIVSLIRKGISSDQS